MHTTYDYDDETSIFAPYQESDFLTNLFAGWGVPGGIARILAGAVLGALSALWALSQSGCAPEQLPTPDIASAGRITIEQALHEHTQAAA